MPPGALQDTTCRKHETLGMPTARTYIAIDLKSFYASVECVERGLDPLTTNLVVADESRTDKTICLAVSPSLKAYGIPGRARLFEVIQKVRLVNAERRQSIGGKTLSGSSVSAVELKKHPEMAVAYITATPRMAHYIDCSARVYNVYLKYIAPEDIHVYSIDEVFMDVTPYLATYKMTAHELAMTIIRDVLRTTGITATAGIGTNMYLCKIAMDIVAKHKQADSDGVRIAEIDEAAYRRQLWSHTPLTDFWQVGKGTASRLAMYGIYTMGDIARQSVNDEELLYSLFGVNAELLIDHAWGWEPCTISDVKAYRPSTHSMSTGQVLTSPYTYNKALVVAREMAETIALELLDKHLTTNQIVLTVGYDKESLSQTGDTGAKYKGETTTDRYGRQIPKHAHGTANIGRHTSSARLIGNAVADVFRRVVNADLLIRRINITATSLVGESMAAQEKPEPVQLDLFADNTAAANSRRREADALAKERKAQQTVLQIKKRYGKNAILKGLNFDDGATARQRNNQIGGHRA